MLFYAPPPTGRIGAMEPDRKTSRWQFPLWSLLIVVLIAPPVIAGGYFLLRAMSAPLWAVAIGAAQIAVWLIVLFFVVRRWLPNP
jgi:hypothetical protein